MDQDEKIYHHSEHYFDDLIKAIDNAQHQITLETYIFADDALGQRMARHLSAAAERGVDVKVLVDAIGTSHWGSSRLAKQLEQAGVKTRIFHPLPWQIWNWSRSVTRVPWLMKWIVFLFTANSRNHRKTCIIDNKIAFVGSQNIIVNHLPLEKDGKGWRDTACQIGNTPLDPLIQAFDTAWGKRKIKERLWDTFRYVVKNPVFRLNYNRHRRRVLHKNLLKIIERARQKIWITNAYFVPDNRLLKRLKEAAAMGVDVRILLPKKSNVFFMTWASSMFYLQLLKSGVRIFEYRPSMIHAKTLIVDDWMTVGSSNLNHRSLLHDLEVDVNIRNTTCKATLANQFEKDLTLSDEITLKTWRKRPFRQWLLGYFVLYLKYWL